MLRFGTIGSGWITDEYIHGAVDSGLWQRIDLPVDELDRDDEPRLPIQASRHQSYRLCRLCLGISLCRTRVFAHPRRIAGLRHLWGSARGEYV